MARMILPSRSLATGVGALPHTDPNQACDDVLSLFPAFPYIPTLPDRSQLESIVFNDSEQLCHRRRPLRKKSKQLSPALRSANSAGPSPDPARSAGLTPARRHWFRLLAGLGIPMVLLVAVEVVLRLGGYGYTTSFLLEHRVNDRRMWIDNQDFGRRFFPPGLVRYPKPMTVPVT